jgi:hypothetical protein
MVTNAGHGLTFGEAKQRQPQLLWRVTKSAEEHGGAIIWGRLRRNTDVRAETTKTNGCIFSSSGCAMQQLSLLGYFMSIWTMRRIISIGHAQNRFQSTNLHLHKA